MPSAEPRQQPGLQWGLARLSLSGDFSSVGGGSAVSPRCWVGLKQGRVGSGCPVTDHTHWLIPGHFGQPGPAGTSSSSAGAAVTKTGTALDEGPGKPLLLSHVHRSCEG